MDEKKMDFYPERNPERARWRAEAFKREKSVFVNLA